MMALEQVGLTKSEWPSIVWGHKEDGMLEGILILATMVGAIVVLSRILRAAPAESPMFRDLVAAGAGRVCSVCSALRGGASGLADDADSNCGLAVSGKIVGHVTPAPIDGCIHGVVWAAATEAPLPARQYQSVTSKRAQMPGNFYIRFTFE